MSIINPRTGRQIVIGGPTYKRLVKEGHIKEQRVQRTILDSILVNIVLPRLNIVTICRLAATNSAIRRLTTEETFWYAHVNTFPLRHTNEVVKQLAGGHPWRKYAMMFSPKKLTRLYGTGVLRNMETFVGGQTVWEPIPLKLEQPVIDWQFTGDSYIYLDLQNTLHIIRRTDKYDLFYDRYVERIDHQRHASVVQWHFTPTSINNQKHLIILKQDGAIYIDDKKIDFIDQIVSFEVIYDYRPIVYNFIPNHQILMLTNKGDIYVTSFKESRVFRQLINTQIPIVRIRIVFDTLYTIDVEGSCYKYSIDVSAQEATVRSSKKIPLTRVVDVGIVGEGRIYLTDEEELYVVGNNYTRVLPTPKKDIANLTKLPLQHVVDFEVDSFHSAFVTAEGRVYTSGSTNSGQLGIGKVQSSQKRGPNLLPLENILAVRLYGSVTYMLGSA